MRFHGGNMRKIAVFIGDYGAYELAIVDAVTAEAERLGYKTVIFSNAGSYGQNIFHAFGEKSVIKIPELSDYEGIVVCPDILGVQGMYEELAEQIEETATCPVVCIRDQDERFYNVLFNNRKAMQKMVGHLISAHGLEQICFMGGRPELKDSQERYLGYQDVMNQCGIEVTQRMVFEGDYWRNKGDQAVEWFLGGEKMPQAIVCGNDFMAIAVCQALQKRGIRVPEDIAVTGFDDVDEVKYSVPTISSMYVPNDEMGKMAVRVIDNVNHGLSQPKTVYVDVKESYKESCGCSFVLDKEVQRNLFLDTSDMRKVLNRIVYMDMDFEAAATFEDLMDSAQEYMAGFAYRAMYICLCDEEEKRTEEVAMMENYTKYMTLRAVLTPDGVQIKNQKFLRKEILPKEFLQDGMHLHVSPLHEKNNCLGYVVFKTKEMDDMRYFFRGWLLGIAISMERQKMYAENKLLMEGRLQYEQDELTGIRNRRGMETILQRRYTTLCNEGTGFYILSVDMDGLKMINDKYGHLEGDEALCAIARILDRQKGENGDVARIGGDEYLLCLGTDDEAEVKKVIADIREVVEEENARSNKPYRLSVSIGYAPCKKKTGIMECMRVADRNMYKEKRKKKEARKD